MPGGKIKIKRDGLVPLARVVEKVNWLSRTRVYAIAKELADEGKIKMERFGLYWYVSPNALEEIQKLKFNGD